MSPGKPLHARSNSIEIFSVFFVVLLVVAVVPVLKTISPPSHMWDSFVMCSTSTRNGHYSIRISVFAFSKNTLPISTKLLTDIGHWN